MFNRPLLASCLFFVAFSFSLAEPGPEQKKLVGSWKYEAGDTVATYDFRPDGTFSSVVSQGNTVRKFEGRWMLDGDKITYKYTAVDPSVKASGLREIDQLVRIDESSYTVATGDQNLWTYWKAK